MRGRKPILRAIRAFIIDVEIYPREGTETLPANHCETDYRVEIYPREGTETRASACWTRLYITLKFIPVRGRKHLLPCLFFRFLVEIYPREGTETVRPFYFDKIA